MLLIILIAGFVLYFLPSILSAAGSHSSTVEILLVNLFLGWTIVGWAACLAWSLFKPRNQVDQMIVCAPALFLFRAQRIAAAQDLPPKPSAVASNVEAVNFRQLSNSFAGNS
jgi:T4 superinfection immunity protein